MSEDKWIVSDCGKTPSVRGCKLVMTAPAGQEEDLLDAAVAHAVKSHEHEEAPELREEIRKTFEYVTK